MKLFLSAILVPQALSVPVANPQDPQTETTKPNLLVKPKLPSLPDVPDVELPNLPNLPNLPSIPEEVLDVLDYVPDPRDIPIIKFLSNDLYKCGWHFYQPQKIAEAVRWGMFYKRVGIFLGFRRYPHRFFNKEKFNFKVEGPYYEFPILRIGKIFTGDSPLQDRVVFTENGDLAGLVTHVGKKKVVIDGVEVEKDNVFEKCKRLPSVMETAKDIVTKPFREDGEGKEGEEEVQQGELTEGDDTNVDLDDGTDSNLSLDDGADSSLTLDTNIDNGGDGGGD